MSHPDEPSPDEHSPIDPPQEARGPISYMARNGGRRQPAHVLHSGGRLLLCARPGPGSLPGDFPGPGHHFGSLSRGHARRGRRVDPAQDRGTDRGGGRHQGGSLDGSRGTGFADGRTPARRGCRRGARRHQGPGRPDPDLPGRSRASRGHRADQSPERHPAGAVRRRRRANSEGAGLSHRRRALGATGGLLRRDDRHSRLRDLRRGPSASAAGAGPDPRGGRRRGAGRVPRPFRREHRHPGRGSAHPHHRTELHPARLRGHHRPQPDRRHRGAPRRHRRGARRLPRCGPDHPLQGSARSLCRGVPDFGREGARHRRGGRGAPGGRGRPLAAGRGGTRGVEQHRADLREPPRAAGEERPHRAGARAPLPDPVPGSQARVLGGGRDRGVLRRHLRRDELAGRVHQHDDALRLHPRRGNRRRRRRCRRREHLRGTRKGLARGGRVHPRDPPHHGPGHLRRPHHRGGVLPAVLRPERNGEAHDDAAHHRDLRPHVLAGRVAPGSAQPPVAHAASRQAPAPIPGSPGSLASRRGWTGR